MRHSRMLQSEWSAIKRKAGFRVSILAAQAARFYRTSAYDERWTPMRLLAACGNLLGRRAESRRSFNCKRATLRLAFHSTHMT